MKLSVYMGVICFSLLMSFGVHAQTPTPHPNALGQGLYQFEDLSSPKIELTGTNWTICNVISGDFVPSGLCNDTSGETLTFFVEGIDYLTVQALFRSNSQSEFLVCVDASCTRHLSKDTGTSNLAQWAIQVGGNAEINVDTTNGGVFFWDYMQLFPMPIDLSSISGSSGSSPTPTPEPYTIYGSISGTSGDIDTRFDMIVTVGDVAVASALLFLLFSLWAFIFLVIIPRRDHVGK